MNTDTARIDVVLCCRDDSGGGGAAGAPVGSSEKAGYDDPAGDAADRETRDLTAVAAQVCDAPVHHVGRRPKKAIDPLLAGRVLVIGDERDLNAVVLRLLRKNLLADVALAYAPPRADAVTKLYGLPSGNAAVTAAARADAAAHPVTLARSDAGGVLIGSGMLAPITGTVYVDEHRVLSGAAQSVTVTPHPAHGLRVTIRRKRLFGIGPKPATRLGRAVECGLATRDTAITFDGITHPRPMERWVFYKHTEPLLLVGAADPARSS